MHAKCGYAHSQTPTFNASPIVSSALDACRRGVQVTLYLDLGFNDQGETIPFQGGTNEEVVHRMYKTLNSEGNGGEKRLKVFWYTGKDQIKPLNAAMKKRNCHGAFPLRAIFQGSMLMESAGISQSSSCR